MEIDDHVEELASDLDVDKAEVRRDLENLVSYSVPIDEAKRNLRRKHGGSAGGEPEPTDIADVTPESGNVTVTARVLTVGKRSIRYQGDEQVIREGELADDTGTISYTAWEDFGLEPGDTITVANAGVREFAGQPELNLGESSTVTFEPADLEVPYRVGGDADLADLEIGDGGRNVEVRVLEVDERTIDGRDGETDILDGVLADDTARLPFTDWDPREAIREGASLRLENVYVREFRGVPSVNVSEFSTAEPLDRAVEVAESGTRMRIRDAVDAGGTYDVELEGSVVAVREGSGLIQRCPECGRVVRNGECRSHGEVDGEDDLRTKAILDDGTDTVTVVLQADLTADVYGGDLEAARQQARDAMDREVVADAIRERVVGRTFRARGHLSVDDYGANLEATEFEAEANDPADRAAALFGEVAE
ncbi:MAG: Single-stranded DNA binding protein [Halobacteriales archaeon]